MSGKIHAIPKEFEEAKESILNVVFRPELTVKEIPAPQKVAEHSIAFAAGVKGFNSDNETDEFESEAGVGRFILLYDKSSSQEWGNVFRVVSFAQAPLEPEIGTDPFIADVAWSWLIDALVHSGAKYDQIAGTATNTISTGYGTLASETNSTQLELRASWTPLGTDFGKHAEAWSHLLCMLAGLPLFPGTASIDSKRIQSKKRR